MAKPSADIAKFDLRSGDVAERRRQEILRLFPEARSESGGISFDVLRLALGDQVESGPEMFGMSWPGKSEAIKSIQQQSVATLLPDVDSSVDWDSAENVVIEGDNLEVLKLLQKSYSNKVKMIYIDPPYNTGNDFVYPDNYAESLRTYLQYTGQIDSEGKRFSSNTESSGRFHSKWLNMMYPRLTISRQLLASDGLLFVSIDDSEFPRLIALLNEIYGEENFIGTMIIEGTPKNDPKVLSTAHEYCVCYAKDIGVASNAGFGVQNETLSQLQKIFSQYHSSPKQLQETLEKFLDGLSDELSNFRNYKYFDQHGIFRTGPIDDPQGSGPRDNRINPRTGNPCKTPASGWRCNLETWHKWLAQDLIWFPENDEQLPAKKTYASSDRREPLRALQKIQSRKTTQYLKNLFDTEVCIFPNPKPTDLLDLLVDLVTEPLENEPTLILDFFAGSGSLADVCMRKNHARNTNIRTISIQLPETIDPQKATSARDKKRAEVAVSFLSSIGRPATISEILKERIRRVSSITGTGFRAFKLNESSFSVWDPNAIEGDESKLEQQLFAQVEHVLPGRTNTDILYELMLKSRYELTTPVEKVKVSKCEIWKVAGGELVVVIEKGLTLDAVREVAAWKPVSVVVLDRCFDGDDSLKANTRKILEDSNIDLKTV
jgi:adenine-specific DNA-methyltransferase